MLGSSRRIATLVSTGCDVIDVFRPRHDRGVQTLIEERLTSREVPGRLVVTEAITDPQTGRRMNISDALRSGLFDIAAGGKLGCKSAVSIKRRPIAFSIECGSSTIPHCLEWYKLLG